MGYAVPIHRWVSLAAFGLLAVLSLSCPSGDKAPGDTGVCETPGYGTLHLSFVMADAYSESVREELDDRMLLSIAHVVDPIDSCVHYQSTRSEYVDGMTTSLDLEVDFQVPVGQTCGDTDGDIRSDDQPGHYIYCDGDLDLIIMQECTDMDAVIVVTCGLAEYEDTAEGA